MSVWLIVALVLANVALNTTGTLMLKLAAITANPMGGIGGVACYVLAASLFVTLAEEQPLSWLAVVTSVLALVSVTLISVVIFKENLATVHLVGIAFALIAVALISIPASGQ